MVDIKITVKAYSVHQTRFRLYYNNISFSESDLALIASEVMLRCSEIQVPQFKAIIHIRSLSGFKKARVIMPLFLKSNGYFKQWLEKTFEGARAFFD